MTNKKPTKEEHLVQAAIQQIDSSLTMIQEHLNVISSCFSVVKNFCAGKLELEDVDKEEE